MSYMNKLFSSLDNSIADANKYYRDFDRSFQECRPNMIKRGYDADYSKYAEKPEIYRDMPDSSIIKTHKGKGNCGVCLEDSKTLTNMYFCRVCDIIICGDCYGMMWRCKNGEKKWRPIHYVGHYTTTLIETQPDCPQCKTNAPFSHRGVMATKLKCLDGRQVIQDDIYDDIVLQKQIKEFIVMNNEYVDKYRLALQQNHDTATKIQQLIIDEGIIAGFDKKVAEFDSAIRELERERDLIHIEKSVKNIEYDGMLDVGMENPYNIYNNGDNMRESMLPYVVRERENGMWYNSDGVPSIDDASMNAIYMRFMRPSPFDDKKNKEIDAKVGEMGDRHEQLAMGVIAIERVAPTNIDEFIKNITEKEKAELIAKLMGGSK